MYAVIWNGSNVVGDGFQFKFSLICLPNLILTHKVTTTKTCHMRIWKKKKQNIRTENNRNGPFGRFVNTAAVCWWVCFCVFLTFHLVFTANKIMSSFRLVHKLRHNYCLKHSSSASDNGVKCHWKTSALWHHISHQENLNKLFDGLFLMALSIYIVFCCRTQPRRTPDPFNP